MRLPTQNPVTLPFGSSDPPYSSTSKHRGTDFSYKPDDTIYAPADGVVTLRSNNGNDGNGVYMKAEGYSIGLLHTSKYLVGNGESVKAGQPVAIMGDTGLAQGRHLRWAVTKDGAFVDPLSTVKEDDDVIQTDDDAAEVIRSVYKREPTQGEIKDLKGRNWKDALLIYRTNEAGQSVHAAVHKYDEIQGIVNS